MVEQIEIRPLANATEAELCAQFMASSEPWTKLGSTYVGLLKVLTDSAKEVYVAVSGDELVGLIVIDMRGSFIGYIKTVGVFPGWQGQGIGRKLIAFAEARIFRESPNAFICVSSFNARAQRLYAELGYQLVGRLTDYLVTGYDEILLRKTIAPISAFKRPS